MQLKPEGTYDILLTQRFILQPRLDFDAAVQSAEKFGVGKGVNSLGLSVRLRYEIRREFAPYVGVQWLNRFGETADISRRGGGRAEDFAVVFGVRLWSQSSNISMPPFAPKKRGVNRHYEIV